MKERIMKGGLSKGERAALRRIANNLRTNSVVVRYCRRHNRWEWFDPIDAENGWYGTLPSELSREEVERELEKMYYCQMCDSIHASFHFL